MPHQCTQCGHTFPDGSKEMLSGCPDCGGNKFQFKPTSDARESARSNPSPETESPSSPTSTETTPTDESAPASDSATSDNRAQADSRRDELAAGSEAFDFDRRADSETTADPPAEADEASDMAALREELNDQFESIKILEPGQYELNLMELYNREEYIIALQEDGQYVIEVPETWL